MSFLLAWTSPEERWIFFFRISFFDFRRSLFFHDIFVCVLTHCTYLKHEEPARQNKGKLSNDFTLVPLLPLTIAYVFLGRNMTEPAIANRPLSKSRRLPNKMVVLRSFTSPPISKINVRFLAAMKQFTIFSVPENPHVHFFHFREKSRL